MISSVSEITRICMFVIRTSSIELVRKINLRTRRIINDWVGYGKPCGTPAPEPPSPLMAAVMMNVTRPRTMSPAER